MRWPNFIIVGFLGATFIQTFPFRGRVLESLNDKIDPVVDVLGVWSAPWDLFSPSTDKENQRIYVRYKLRGVSKSEDWYSDDWATLNCFEKFTRSRECEFFESLRLKGNSPALKSWARILKADFEKNRNSGEPRLEGIEIGVELEWIPVPNGDGAPQSGKNIQTTDLFIQYY